METPPDASESMLRNIWYSVRSVWNPRWEHLESPPGTSRIYVGHACMTGKFFFTFVSVWNSRRKFSKSPFWKSGSIFGMELRRKHLAFPSSTFGNIWNLHSERLESSSKAFGIFVWNLWNSRLEPFESFCRKRLDSPSEQCVEDKPRRFRESREHLKSMPCTTGISVGKPLAT